MCDGKQPMDKKVTQQVERILTEFHRKLQRKYVRRDKHLRASDDVLLESYLYMVLDECPEQRPGECRQRIQELFGKDVSNDRFIERLRHTNMNIVDNRKVWFAWFEGLRVLFMKALYGDVSAYTAFVQKRQTPPEGPGKGRGGEVLPTHRAMRILLLTLFNRESVLNQYEDLAVLISLKNVLAFYCLEDIEEIIGYVYDFPKVAQILKANGKDTLLKSDSTAVPVNIAELQALATKAGRLEEELERTEGMLQDLQDDFDRQIEEAKVMELTEFFSRLNSDTYGSIIDELFALRRGIDRLRRESYDLPLEIRGLMIMATKLLQFVKDSHIDPLMKLHAVLEVSADDIENCIYEGTPFVGAERKRVQVISPGWIYRDKEIQISRPKVKEVE